MFLTKTFPGGLRLAIASGGDIIVNPGDLEGATDQDLINAFREIAADALVLEKYLGGNALDGFETIEQAKSFVSTSTQTARSQEVKQALTKVRRVEFNGKRDQTVLALIDRDGYICQAQECDMQQDLTVDHVVPISRGGTDELENLRLLCRQHNSQKGDRPLPRAPL